MSFDVKAYGVLSEEEKTLVPVTIQRRNPGPRDVKFEILYCGICHSDIHTAYSEWRDGNDKTTTQFPAILGHEVVGRVSEIGSDVTKVKVGSIVGVGCLVGSCANCTNCHAHDEQMCNNAIGTYNAPEPILGGHTFCGYSTDMVADEASIIVIPKSMHENLAGVAPLLCAGITAYSPLVEHGCTSGMNVAVIGLGGLGHMAIKFAVAMGANVTLFTTSLSKVEDAKRLGCKDVIISTDPEQMAAVGRHFDIIIDAVSANHDVNRLLCTLKPRGVLVLIGAPADPLQISAFALLRNNVRLAGSGIGGFKMTQDMINFCGEKGIYSDIEMVNMDQVNEAYGRVLKQDVKYRFVIDMDTLRQ